MLPGWRKVGAFKILTGILTEKRTLVRPRRRWEDLKEIGIKYASYYSKAVGSFHFALRELSQRDMTMDTNITKRMHWGALLPPRCLQKLRQYHNYFFQRGKHMIFYLNFICLFISQIPSGIYYSSGGKI